VKRYSAKGFTKNGITNANMEALEAETYTLAERLIECCRAYAAETGRDLSHHPHLHEYAEINLQAAVVLLAGSTSCSIEDTSSSEDLERAILVLRTRHAATRRHIKTQRGLKIIRRDDLN